MNIKAFQEGYIFKTASMLNTSRLNTTKAGGIVQTPQPVQTGELSVKPTSSLKKSSKARSPYRSLQSAVSKKLSARGAVSSATKGVANALGMGSRLGKAL